MELWIRRTQRLFPPECFENTFLAIQSTFRSLEKHARRRFKICCNNAVHWFFSFEITRASVIIYRKFFMKFDVLRK